MYVSKIVCVIKFKMDHKYWTKKYVETLRTLSIGESLIDERVDYLLRRISRNSCLDELRDGNDSSIILKKNLVEDILKMLHMCVSTRYSFLHYAK